MANFENTINCLGITDYNSYTLEDVTELLLNHSDVDTQNYSPYITPKSNKIKMSLDNVSNWDNLKDKTTLNCNNMEAIKEYQIKYSKRKINMKISNPLRRLWERKGTNYSELKTNFLDTLPKKDTSMLCIGPRWPLEITWVRNTFGFNNVTGLDLFSTDENLVVKGDMHQMPFENNSFNVVYQRNTFNKSYDIRKALDECVRVLKPGGYLISDDCYDYNVGVNELTRTNILCNEWMIKYLGDNVSKVVINENQKEKGSSKQGYDLSGLLCVKIC